jgi:hypothetical protein
MGLVGKFVFHCGAEYSQWGEVVDQIGDDVFLIKFDRQDKNLPIPVSTLAFDACDFITTLDDEGNPDAEWIFYDTRKELDAYVSWLYAEPSEKKAKPVVVKLHS